MTAADGTRKIATDDIIKLWDNISGMECLPEDAELDTILDEIMISNDGGFDLNEKVTWQMDYRENQIAKLCQLGD